MNNKRIQTTFLLYALLMTPVIARADTWGLLVGVSKYQNTQITSLKYPSKDAEGLFDVLTSPDYGRIPKDHVKQLTDDEATFANINDAVDGFLTKNVKAGDEVIISLAGHGIAKGIGVEARSYFLPTNVRGLSSTALETSAVSMKTLSEKLSKLPASQFIVFVDACREDPTPGRGLKENQRSDVLTRDMQVVPSNRGASSASVTFFACQVGQRAYESPTLQHGVFTNFIIEAIKDASLATPKDRALEMGRLASYVKKRVSAWADDTAKAESSDIQQSPELITPLTSDQPEPIVLLHVAKASSGAPQMADAPELVVRTDNSNARISVNGVLVGTGEEVSAKAKQGENRLKIDVPGKLPIERTLQLQSGYKYVFIPKIAAKAGTTEIAPPAPGKEDDILLQEAIDSDKRGDYSKAIEILIKRSSVSPDAQGYSLLARTYARVAEKDRMSKPPEPEVKSSDDGGGGVLGKIKGIFGGKKKKNEEPAPAARSVEAVGDFRSDASGADASLFALKAANLAIEKDQDASQTHQARGFALISADRKGENRDEALSEFDKALSHDSMDPVNHFGMGFSLRYFSTFIRNANNRKSDLEKAVSELKRAVELRPNYYSAHRELGICYLILGMKKEARQENDIAYANRGEADDEKEVAGIEVSQSVILRSEAKDSKGSDRSALEQEADGYLSDAKDLADLKQVMNVVSRLGYPRSFADFLPADGRRIFDLFSRGGFSPQDLLK